MENVWVHSSRRSSLLASGARAQAQAPGRAKERLSKLAQRNTPDAILILTSILYAILRSWFDDGRAHQARRCCAASCKERFLASSSRRTDTSGGSWSTVCNTFTTGHVVMGVFIRLKARTPSGDAETRRHCPRDDIYTWKCGRIGTSASVVVEL